MSDLPASRANRQRHVRVRLRLGTALMLAVRAPPALMLALRAPPALMLALRAPPALGEAYLGLHRHPLRSLLAMLGVVVAVTAVVSSMAMLRLSRDMSTASMARFGALDVVRISSPEDIWRDGRRIHNRKRADLDERDAERLLAVIPGVRDSSVRVTVSTTVRRRAVSFGMEVSGVDEKGLALDNLELVAGRFIHPREVLEEQRVVVLSRSLAQDLFGTEEPIGGEVLLGNERFTVIGLVRTPVWFWNEGEEQRVALVPFKTAFHRLGAQPEEAEIQLRTISIDRLQEVREAIESFLNSLRPGCDADNFEVETAEQMLKNSVAELRLESLLLGTIALLVIVAAASGILNTFIVSVRERTREIGTRRALGAPSRSILYQFLIEAVLLAIPGALAGLLSGGALAHYLAGTLVDTGSGATPVQLVLNTNDSLTAIVVGVVIAGLASVWPAWAAAQISPSEALRHE